MHNIGKKQNIEKHAIDRRTFLKTLAFTGCSIALCPHSSGASMDTKQDKDTWMSCLVDLTLCNGCRKCEWACAKENERTEFPIKEYDNKNVFENFRRPTTDSYTVVNKFISKSDSKKDIFVKAQCMHCNDPACLSACIVGAFSKENNGTVKYTPWKCMGCRYCMIACPFEIPAYEYYNTLTPQVRKCTFCFNKISKEGGITACAKVCPVEAISYGPRKTILAAAHARINNNPDKYIDHIYGEHEAGGTSWMYISSEPFENFRFPKLGPEPLPSFTEPIQHGLFKKFIPQIALFSFLGAAMYLFKPGKDN